MDNEWRTQEPEVGQVAWIKNGDARFGPVVCEVSDIGIKNWLSAHMFWSIYHPDFKYWQPITTPEERRLRAEVERLNFDMGRLADVLREAGDLIDSIGNGSTCSMVNRIRDVLADTDQEGGGDE